MIVTRSTEDFYLPPTYTPTFTPTATETPLPSPTPYPLGEFQMVFTSLLPGAAQPSLFTAAGDGSLPRLLVDDVIVWGIDTFSGE